MPVNKFRQKFEEVQRRKKQSMFDVLSTLYEEHSLSLSSIGKILKVNKKTVRSWILSQGIKLRPRVSKGLYSQHFIAMNNRVLGKTGYPFGWWIKHKKWESSSVLAKRIGCHQETILKYRHVFGYCWLHPKLRKME